MKITLPLVIALFAFAKGNIIGAGELDGDERIWLGKTAAAGQFPWQALLVMTTSSNQQSFCGGSLITPNYILTAAHCCQNIVNHKVYLGLLLSGDRDTGSYVQKFDVPAENQVIHENYDNSTISNDICLLKLPSDAEMNSNVSTVALPQQDTNPSQYDGKTATVSGFGQTSTLGGISSKLLYADVRLVSHSICVLEYSFINKVTDSQLCSSKLFPWRGPCKGDSGGALTINGSDGKPMEIGIVSWTVGICSLSKPVVYTYVPAFVDWINSKIA